MGTSASCSIALASTGKPFYWTGETVSGNVVLTVNRSHNVKSIDVAIIGQLIYTETRRRGRGSTTVTVRKNFYVERQPLLIPATNGISYDEDGYHLEPNTYHWPFSIRLAKTLPPSLNYVKQSIPYIIYFVAVHLVCPGFHRNIRSTARITVTPRVPQPRNIWSLENEEVNFRDLYIYGKLLRSYLLIGEPYITLELLIQNLSQTTIKEIIVKLVQRRRLAQKYAEVVIFEQPLQDITDFQHNYLHQTFQVPVPPSLLLFAPSYRYRGPGNAGELYIIDYILEVKIKTKLFFTNVTLEFPITVANSRKTPRTEYRNTVH